MLAARTLKTALHTLVVQSMSRLSDQDVGRRIGLAAGGINSVNEYLKLQLPLQMDKVKQV